MIDTKNKIIKYANLELRKDPSVVKDGYTIEETNLSQFTAHTAMFAGVKDLTIRKCNVKNCDFPAGTLVEDCPLEGVHEDVVIETPEDPQVFTDAELLETVKAENIIDEEVGTWPEAWQKIKDLYTDSEVVEWLELNEVIPELPADKKTMNEAMKELKKAKPTGKVLKKV